MVKKISLYVMSLFYVVAGLNHFKNPEIYLKMIPSFLPSPSVLNALSGAAEMILGMMLIRPATRSLAAWGIILLLIAVFPANVYMYSLGGEAFGLPDWALLVRLPLQLVLVAWAYWHTRNPEIDTLEIQTEILIAAKPLAVWNVLSQFDKYPEWNPFITKTFGAGGLGDRMSMTLRLPDAAEFQFKNTIVEFDAPHKLSWRGSFIVRGLFDGTHFFRVEPNGDGSRFVHGERFEGIFVRVLSGISEGTTRGFVVMNEALKTRCES